MKLQNIAKASVISVIGNSISFVGGLAAGCIVLKATGNEKATGLTFVGTAMAGSYVTGIAATKAAESEKTQEVQ